MCFLYAHHTFIGHSSRNLRLGPVQDRQEIPFGSRDSESDLGPIQRRPASIRAIRPPSVPFQPAASPLPRRNISVDRARDALGLRETTDRKQRRLSPRNSGYPEPWNALTRNAPRGFRFARANSSASSQRCAPRAWSLALTPDRWGAMSEITRSAFSPPSARITIASTASSRKSPSMTVTPATGLIGRISTALP